MRRGSALALVLVLASSGCVNPQGDKDTQQQPQVGDFGPFFYDTDAKTGTGGPDTVWVIELKGQEDWRLRGGDRESLSEFECTPKWLYTVDDKAQRVEYNRKTVAINTSSLKILLLYSFEAVVVSARHVSTGCPAPMTMHASAMDVESVRKSIGHFGDVRIQAFNQGTLGIQEQYPVVLGRGIQYNFTRIVNSTEHSFWVFGSFTIENHGAWPKSAIVAKD
jgi:hypothetical protein